MTVGIAVAEVWAGVVRSSAELFDEQDTIIVINVIDAIRVNVVLNGLFTKVLSYFYRAFLCECTERVFPYKYFAYPTTKITNHMSVCT